MSSCTVSISSVSSTLRSTLFPPLHLKENKQWEIALLDFTTYNSIPNIIEGVNNKFYYVKNKNSHSSLQSTEAFEFQTGSYEISDINRELQKHLGKEVIELKANNNNLRSEIKCKYYIDFSQPDSIGPLLGFPSSSALLEPNAVHTSVTTVNIIKVNTINITCNIVQGAYKDGSNQHILHTFYPTVPPGFKIVEKPHNLIYLPLNTTYVSDIVLNVLDQDGDIIDFRGEVITIRLHIRQTP
jgi:hypothetical protein